ncbi:MAG: DUF5723 family protein [Thermonemataceae bacterium]
MKFTTTICLLLWINVSSHAQYMLGVTNSNFAGTHAMYLNPARIAQSPHKLYVNVLQIDAQLSNNYYRWNGENLFSAIDDLDLTQLEERPNGNYFVTNLEIRGPAAMYQINDNNSIAIGIRGRVIANANDVSRSIYSLIKEDGEFDDLIGQNYEDTDFNFNGNGFLEYSATYARTILREGPHFLKGGITVKYLSGFGSVHASSEDSDFSIQQDISFADTTDFFQVATLNGNISYSSDDYTDVNASDIFSGQLGNGLGLDIGFSYTYNDETAEEVLGEAARVEPYLFRIGLAITDIGSIRYNGDRTRAYQFANQDIRLEPEEIDLENPENLVTAFNVDLDDFEDNYTVALPTTLNFTFDYRIQPHIYASLTWIQNLRSQDVLGAVYGSLISVTPRYERKMIEVALPISLADNYRNFRLGTTLRLGYWIIGTDHLNGLIGLGSVTGTNLYTGLHLPNFK